MNPLKVERFVKGIQEPLHFRTLFLTESYFIEWLNLGSIADLNAALDAFQNAQMFEDCVIIQRVLNEKINQIVTRID
jgi:hypothetical protein